MEITSQRKRLHLKVRGRRTRLALRGRDMRPRLSVFRSGKHIYAQIIDDQAGKTLAQASDMKAKRDAKSGHAGVDAASTVGAQIAKIALEKKITKVVFDRGGYKYHGRVKALADAARKAGLQF